MKFKDFTLDPFQEQAVHAIERNDSVLVSAPTGSGKTLIADYIIDRDIKEGKKVIYTAPIKALSNQKYRDFVEAYGEDKIGLITGDIVQNSGAQVLIMTTEIYRNMAICKDPMLKTVTYCIMDEVHFISDEDRGYIWEESIIFSPEHIRFVFLSATIPNHKEFAKWVSKIKKHDVKVVQHKERPVPLEKKFFDGELGMTSLEKIREQKELDSYPDYKSARKRRHRTRKVMPPRFEDAIAELRELDKFPTIYFVFSRQKTQDYAMKIARRQFLSENEQTKMQTFLTKQFRSINPELMKLSSTQSLKHCLTNGIAFHHAGMLPDVKHIVEKLFGEGLIKVLFATETFAVGINMPARTVCFDSLRKYTGKGFRYVNSKEFFQISGRAGRRGIDKTGLVVSLIHRPSADLRKIENFTSKDTLPLKSQFQISYNTVLNMIHRHSAEEIDHLLSMNFFTFQEPKGLRSVKARYTNLVRFLKKMKYVVGDELSKLGLFASKVYAHEIELSQLFFSDIEIDEELLLYAIAGLEYEPKRQTVFHKHFQSKKLLKFIKEVRSHPVLKRGDWYQQMPELSALIHPLFEQKKFVDILQYSNLPEGDVIRFYMRLLDTLEQVDQALNMDERVNMVRNCKSLIKQSLEGIHVF